MEPILEILALIPAPLKAGLTLLAIILAVKLVSNATRGTAVLDQRRDFTKAERAGGFTRAGNQCEMESLPFKRCTAPAQHGDHHLPWSKGGSTSMANFVAACAPHNLSKSNHMPSKFSAWRMERRRRKYFPQHIPTTVGHWYGT
jgi:hypothetical protein